MQTDTLPSWADGDARAALVDFVGAATEHVPPSERVAVFDNDGTLWCEKPTYPQLHFFVEALRTAVAARPHLAERAEYRAVLDGDRAAVAVMGIARVAVALVELFAGQTPEQFTSEVQRFFAEVPHPERGVRYGDLRYVPMLEVIDLLRSADFRIFLVTAGGGDFVRAVSMDLYGVPPERVIGSRVTYEMDRSGRGLRLLRTAELDGDPNEGPAKLPSIQRQIGQRPIFAAGNSSGDAEMLEYASTGEDSTLALLVDHDDPMREYAYEGAAGTFAAEEAVLDVAARLGWTVASMRNDWHKVFGASIDP